MCVHSVDGARGWTGECPDSSRCLCGYFPETGPAFPGRHRSASTPSMARTVFRIVLGVVLVLVAVLTLGVWVISPDDDDYRRRRLT